MDAARAPRERLAPYRSVRTRDVLEAESRLARLFSPHTLRPDRAPRRFCATANSVSLGGIRLVYMSLGTATTIRPDPLGYYAANIVLAGYGEYRQAAGAVSTGGRCVGAVLNPGSPTEMFVDDGCAHLSVLVSRQALESRREAAGTLDDGVCLAMPLDLRSPKTQSWVDLVSWTVRSAESGGLLDNRLAAAHVEDLVILGLLDAQRVKAEGEERTDRKLPARIARVVDLVHADPGQPLTLSQLAAVAGVSVRSLQAGFRRHLGTSPSQYLRFVRLDRARADLQRAGDAPTTVTDVALRWGFTHVPRFAALYRDRFGELPSQTLRRR
ncbi:MULTISPECIES: AraC family transcriptional regulator [Amycolatopsis]|uniref:AraC family transcriptional regulator n=1 Tax=Amycolatopsis TaxID=1813 RepID=UPI001F416453|nr:AraC family transcriptional regulator [Amycolatopsis tucumanensis]MCF6424129.1 AraC family transcriptional regulator [Amycolatopsis tucumanensis]